MTYRPILAAIACCGVSWAHADELVDRADANGDGFVSLYELRAAHYADEAFNRRIERSFDGYDRNGDGLISEDELLAARGSATTGKTPAQPAGAGASTESARTEGTAGTAVSQSGASSPRAIDPSPGLSLSSSPSPSPSPNPSPSASRNTARSGGGAVADPMDRWVGEVDKDGSGGASAVELVASGGGVPWFSRAEFDAADRNGDGELNATELGQLVRSLERRQR